MHRAFRWPLRSLWLFLPFAVLPVPAEAQYQPQPFNRANCVTTLTVGRDPPHRRAPRVAQNQCRSIERRTQLLQRRMLGRWQRLYQGHRESLLFRPDGTFSFTFADRHEGSAPDTGTWAIDNPYAAPGMEQLTRSGGVEDANIRFVGNLLIMRIPQSHGRDTVQRWTRVASGAHAVGRTD